LAAENTPLDSILGCLVGGAIGDAFGSAWEGSAGEPRNHSAIDASRLRLTDDTQLTLATCEAIVERGLPEPEAIAASMLRWFRQGRLTGLGSSTLKSLRDHDAGAHWALAGAEGERSAGNGAAMRIAPLAFYLDPSDDADRRKIRDIVRITHRHDEAYAGALAVVAAIRNAIRGDLSLRTVAGTLPDSLIRDRLRALAEIPPQTPLTEIAARYGSGAYVAVSVPLAIGASIRGIEHGFASMLDEILTLGGDTDTNASIAGQITGARLGLTGLPLESIERLPERELVLTTARTLAETVRGRTGAGSNSD
jgi:ADP-ribosyl-[dinitrogen reductase] hydrolase